MKLAWLTDLHLNFIPKHWPLDQSYTGVNLVPWKTDAILVGGDTAEAGSLEFWLTRLAKTYKVPVYFVLGNHDYYGSGIEEVREIAKRLSTTNDLLHWLPDCGDVRLTQHTALVGHGGWGDGRLGDFLDSTIVLNDYLKIRDLFAASSQGPKRLLAKLNELGDEAALRLLASLTYALLARDRVIVLTHVPPFAEAAWHEGEASDANWRPHFTCGAIGDMLLSVAAANPTKAIHVLCGHSHGGGECWPAPNLRVTTGAAVYEHPAVQPPILVP